MHGRKDAHLVKHHHPPRFSQVSTVGFAEQSYQKQHNLPSNSGYIRSHVAKASPRVTQGLMLDDAQDGGRKRALTDEICQSRSGQHCIREVLMERDFKVSYEAGLQGMIMENLCMSRSLHCNCITISSRTRGVAWLCGCRLAFPIGPASSPEANAKDIVQ